MLPLALLFIRTFSYAIPPSLTVEVGQAVWVPFGAKLLQGIVLKLRAQPTVEETKEIAGIIDTRPVLSPTQVTLAYWLSDYYLAPIFDTIALMLPPGFERKAQTFVSPTIPDGFDLSQLSTEQKHALVSRIKYGTKQSKISLRELERSLGKKKAQRLVAQLVRRGLLVRSYELEPIKVKPKIDLYLSLTITTGEAQQAVAKLLLKRASRQAALLNFLAQQPRQVSLTEMRQKVNCDKIAADALVKKGLITIQPIASRRDPLAYLKTVPSSPLSLTAAQASAFKAIQSSLPGTTKGDILSAVFLLHGVTGSGKTEIYLQSLAETIKLGKRGIVLVPEIALTPQTIECFAARFPGRVAILHSQLSLGERFDEWQRIRNGEFDVVIGPRSALFAPQPELGLIVIDEEHEWNYKQSDQSPHYHARNAAIKLAELSSAVVILGSATPDVETFYHVQKGDYRLLPLPERLTPTESSPLPRVEVIDLRDELKAGNRSLFSRSLSQAITKALACNEQVILFLNRRGASTFIQCRQCGFALSCRRCDVALTYHSIEDALVCHQCNYRTPTPQICPRCRSRRIKFLGMGTEKLEQETAQAFQQARLLRWDSDTTQQKYSHQAILDKFRDHQADILIGTQLVSKGLDLPQVTLVGVINADTGLNLPDFRAGEHTFQLLSQVAGRAGRGPLDGQVIIQTYTPEHYAIQAAAKHNYALFNKKELDYRRQLHQPPFTRLARLIYTHTNDGLCRREAERMKRALIEEKEAKGVADLSVIGPAPAFIHRRRGRFRWQLILRGSNPSAFLSEIPVPQGWTIDIDPIGLV